MGSPDKKMAEAKTNIGATSENFELQLLISQECFMLSTIGEQRNQPKYILCWTQDLVNFGPLRGYLYVKIKHACSCPKRFEQFWTLLGSFGQSHATGMRVLVFTCTKP